MIVANVVPRPPRSSHNLLNLHETVLVSLSATYVVESVSVAQSQSSREGGALPARDVRPSRVRSV